MIADWLLAPVTLPAWQMLAGDLLVLSLVAVVLALVSRLSRR